MSILPQIESDTSLEDSTETIIIPSKTYKMSEERIAGYVDNLEAVKQAVYHILNVERYSCDIYDDDYGVELEQYIGESFEYLEVTIEDTLNQLYLIAARKKVKCSFKKYLELIKNESLKVNVNAKKSNLVINLSEIPMNVEDVEKGINIGNEIIKSKSKKL